MADPAASLLRRHRQAVAGLVGVLGYGVGAYAFLVIVGRVLGADSFSDLSVLWTAVFVGVVGLLVPVEQEGARAMGTAVATGADAALVEEEVRASAVAVAACSAALVLVASPLIAEELFSDRLGFVPVLAAALVAYGFVHSARAVLVGAGRLDRFCALLLVDSVVRLVLLGLLVAGGFRSGLALALAIPASPLIALALVSPSALRLRRAPGGWFPLLRRIGPMVIAAIVGQLAVSFPALAARLLSAGGDDPVLGSFLASLTLARAPILLFGAFEAALVPSLTAHAAHGRIAELRRVMVRYTAIVGVVGALCTLVGAVLIRPVLRIGFGAGYGFTLGPVVLVLAGTGGSLVTLVLGQGLLTLHRRRDLVIPWAAAGAVEILAVVLLGGSIAFRASLAYALGSAVSILVGGVLLVRALRSLERHN